MALLLPKYHAIFLHVPKTGGLFIENFLKSITEVTFLANRHSHIRMIGRAAYEDYFKFCFIRKPSEWYKSYWQMRMSETPIDSDSKAHWYPLGVGHDRGGIHRRHHPTWDIDPVCGSDDLNEFVVNCARLGGFLNRLYDNFIGWGFAKSDYVGEFDSMLDGLEVVLKHLGVAYDPGVLRKKPKFNPSAESQKLRPEVEAEINRVEDLYFKVKKGFQ
jgi:hypothetical protein